jgi:predicted secreted protein
MPKAQPISIMEQRKIVFVPHCILNQSIRERQSDSVKEIVKMFAESDVGIIQLPCPKAGATAKSYRQCCRRISAKTLCDVKDYLSRDCKVLGILGVEQSSTCGVYRIESGKKTVPGKGVFIEELEKGMQKENFQVPIISVNTSNVFSTLEKLSVMIKNS